MDVKFNKRLKEQIVEDFPQIKKETSGSLKETKELNSYFNEHKEDLKAIINLESLKKDEQVDDYVFFEQLLRFCEIILNPSDKDEYLKEVMEGDYYLCSLKTMIPRSEYDLLNDCTVYTVLRATFAVSTSLELDEDHIYTQEEIINLQNINKLRLLSLDDEYQLITAFLYSDLLKEYKNKGIIPLDFATLNKYNYAEIITAYPYLGTYIRNKIDFSIISNILLEYEQILSETVTSEISECEKKIESYHNRLQKIKRLINY